MSAAPVRHLAARAPGWVAPAATGTLAVALTGAVAVLDPATRAAWSPGCPFRTLTGLDCPGCGATRSLYALTQGDLILAVDHNVLLVVLLPILVAVWAAWLARRIRLGRAGLAPVPAASVSMGLAATVALFWVVRNLPWLPFSWLGSSAGG